MEGSFLLLSDLLGAPPGSRLRHFVLNGDSLSVFLEILRGVRHVLSAARTRGACTVAIPVGSQIWPASVRESNCKSRFGVSSAAKANCPRRIFAERLPGLAAAHARNTSRLAQTHGAIGCAVGGEAGSRLTIRLGISTSPDSLLRRVKQLKGNSTAHLRLVGLDDWAWRKGRRYGTIVVDLERAEVVDLLPDRDAECVKSWLKGHPNIELISRDRASSYAQAAAEAAPKAQQVADRWHLLKNLREAIERLLERQSDAVDEAMKAAATAEESPRSLATADIAQGVTTAEPTSPPQPLIEPPPESPRLQAQRARRTRRMERFEQVHERHRQGHSARRIAREIGMSRNAVRHYLRCKECPDWRPGRACAPDGTRTASGSTPLSPKAVRTRRTCTGNWC